MKRPKGQTAITWSCVSLYQTVKMQSSRVQVGLGNMPVSTVEFASATPGLKLACLTQLAKSASEGVDRGALLPNDVCCQKEANL